jgi:hypothetical protein
MVSNTVASMLNAGPLHLPPHRLSRQSSQKMPQGERSWVIECEVLFVLYYSREVSENIDERANKKGVALE